MNVVANGKPRTLDDGVTIGDFLDGIGWRPEWVVVEHNGEPVARTHLRNVVLRDGDRLEVVRAVAGGA